MGKINELERGLSTGPRICFVTVAAAGGCCAFFQDSPFISSMHFGGGWGVAIKSIDFIKSVIATEMEQ